MREPSSQCRIQIVWMPSRQRGFEGSPLLSLVKTLGSLGMVPLPLPSLSGAIR